jgi:hypothetical protein
VVTDPGSVAGSVGSDEGDRPRPLAPGEPGFEGYIRRAYAEGHVTERERDARLVLHRAYRRLAAAREAGRPPTDAERAELAAALELARGRS